MKLAGILLLIMFCTHGIIGFSRVLKLTNYSEKTKSILMYSACLVVLAVILTVYFVFC